MIPPLKLASSVKTELKVLINFFSCIWRGEKGIASRITIILALMILRISSTITVAFLLKNLVSELKSRTSTFQYIILILISYGFVWIFSQIAFSLQGMFMSKIICQSIRRFNMNFMLKLNELPMQFHVNKNSGELMGALERAKVAVYVILQGVLLTIFPTIMELTISAAIFWNMYGVSYSAVMFLGLCFFVFFSIYSSKKLTQIQRESNIVAKKSSSQLFDFLMNFESIRYFNRQYYEASTYDVALKEREAVELKSNNVMEQFNIVQNLILGIVFFILNFMMTLETLKGRGVDDLVFVNSLIIQFLAPLRSFGVIFLNLRRSFVDMEMISNILQTKLLKSRPTRPVKIQEGSIVFKNVSFGYSSSKPLIKNLSFEIQSGKTVGIVGETGIGKSTIPKLLFGFYDVMEGEILIDSHNVQEITASELSEAISIVPQDSMLLNDTIFHNISYGKLDATEEEIKKAAKLSQLDSFIDALPERYQTHVGERGIKLSGGEKQRLAIARALIKNPLIYIFDEATSALDLKTKSEIHTIMRNLTKNKTTIIISHCLTSITDVDQILVLKDGSIVERGTHEELVKKQGAYYQLWLRQCTPV